MRRLLIGCVVLATVVGCSGDSVPMSAADARWGTSADGRVEVQFRLTNDSDRAGTAACQIVVTDADGRRAGSDRVPTDEIDAGVSEFVHVVTGIDAGDVTDVVVHCR